jgi:hypothetical protein
MHQIAIPLRFMATDDAGRSAHKHTGGSHDQEAALYVDYNGFLRGF